MALLLSIETSTTVCSVALHERGKLLVDQEEQTPQSAASLLTPMIDHLFKETGSGKTALEAVAVSAGPGSYTGLRIGVATAKGICYALSIPLIVLDSLHVLADSVEPKPAGHLLAPMIDARRMEVYTCLLNSQFEVVEPTRPLVVEESSFGEVLLKNKVLFFGCGADKCRDLLQHPNAAFQSGIHPQARAMGVQAFRKFEHRDFADVRHFEPAYLKEFVAKTKKA